MAEYWDIFGYFTHIYLKSNLRIQKNGKIYTVFHLKFYGTYKSTKLSADCKNLGKNVH